MTDLQLRIKHSGDLYGQFSRQMEMPATWGWKALALMNITEELLNQLEDDYVY